MSQQEGGDNEMSSLEDSFKERVKEEMTYAELRFHELDLLYSNSLKCEGSFALPREYMTYLKKERDLAYMMFQLKAKGLKELENTKRGRVHKWLLEKL